MAEPAGTQIASGVGDVGARSLWGRCPVPRRALRTDATRPVGRIFISASNEYVGEGGVEPPRPSGHTDLNRARLPFRHSPEVDLDVTTVTSHS